MNRRRDITGITFGRLTPQRELERIGGGWRWECLCQCGNIHFASSANLTSGNVKSCGCLVSEQNRTRGLRHGDAKANAISSEYRAWVSMKARCYNPKKREYKNYGGRGISVCREWMNSFESFKRDMGPKPSKLHSLDRIDNNSGYSPANCRWATKSEQTRNRRSAVLSMTTVNEMRRLHSDGHTASAIAKMYGLKYEYTYRIVVTKTRWPEEPKMPTPEKVEQ